MNENLAELFPDGDYRFHLTLRRAQPRDFFIPGTGAASVLEERVRWLAAEPAQYAALRPEGEPPLREFAAMASAWLPSLAEVTRGTSSAGHILHQIGRSCDSDILFLSADRDGRFRLRGGVLCFPTGWALTDKLGETLDFIHGVVPGLNAALGASIQQFLSKLKPGVAFLRDNWGVAATDELNLHPSRGIAAPSLPVKLDKLWLRVEHQALLALPESRGIVFGIRIALHRLDGIAGGPHSGAFRRALATMPAELADYKRLASIRAHLLNVL